MRIDNNARKIIFWKAELTFNPSGTTVKLRIDSSTYDMVWVGPITTGVNLDGLPVWRQTAQTNQKFIGSDMTKQGDEVQLVPDKYMGEPTVHTTDGQDIPCYPAVPIQIY